MAQLNKKCSCCSTKYSYCPDCSRADALKPSWYSDFCSETCKDLWLTATRFNMNRLAKSDARSIIAGLDLKPIDEYVECIKRDLKNIMAEEKKTRRTQKKIEPVVEAEPIKFEQQEVAESHEVVLKEDDKEL